jgi:hypothetical protein
MSRRLAHITLTGGNLRNSHLYLSDIMDLFPGDAVGGPNEKTKSVRELEIHCGIGDPILTDIAGDKKIFRKRAWVAEFFEVHQLAEDDVVVVGKTGPSRYHIYSRRTV